MSSYLFEDFEGSTPKAWKQNIQVDLKGADYNDTLLWHTDEKITVKPFYTKEDRTHQTIELPESGFSLCQPIYIDDENVANQLAIDALSRGADAIEFSASSKFNYNRVLKNIDISIHKVYFSLSFLDPEFIKTIATHLNSKNCYFNIDIIGHLAKTGNWFTNLKSDHKAIQTILETTTNAIHVDASIYQNAGATITQQLAYALAHANEYLNHYGENIAHQIHFKFAVGSNYFFEIAKLRAFRILWSSLLKIYDVRDTQTHIFSKPSLRNKTLYDYNVNMLRTTSECMSAILGGSDTISNVSYDEIFHKSNEFGERISRNQLLILKEESELSNAQHIADGAYYIETLTEHLTEKSLAIFKLIEQGGGFLKQLKEGVIQRKVKASADHEQELFNNGDIILLGTNALRNESDKMSQDLELYPFAKQRHVKTLIQPILQTRLAEKIEQERLGNE